MGTDQSPSHARAELMWVDRDTWVTISDYPYKSYVAHYSMLYFENGFIIFGSNGATSVIAKLDLQTTSWIKLGDLTLERWNHNVIYDGEVFIVVGGLATNDIKTEKCSLSGSTMTCSEQEPILPGYNEYPALVMVPDDFCTNI